MRTLKKSQGQAMVESLLAIPLIFFSGLALSLLIYRGIVFYLADYHLHEALLCLEEHPPFLCEQELQRQIQRSLIISQNFKIHLQKRTRLSEGSVYIPLSPPIEVRKKFSRGS